MMNELAEIESNILRLLKESTGNILDDVELIDTLAASKKTSETINAKVEEAHVTEQEIDANREKYRPVAYHVTILYFCISDLSIVDPMYQFSLQWFTALFVQGCKKAEASDDFEQRLQSLQDFFTYYLYQAICRSLFEKDKLLFSFAMCVKILQGHNLVDADEWRFLISGTAAASAGGGDDGDDAGNGGGDKGGGGGGGGGGSSWSPPSWVDKRMWSEMQALGTLPAFRGIDASPADGFRRHEEDWRAFYDAVEPQKMPLPGKWGRDGTLNSFQFICALRCMRVDKVPDAVMAYVIEKSKWSKRE
jgi:dynein heavy chain